MNELIEHLAERATKEMDQEAFSEDMNIPAEWYHKFAELIVRECAHIAWLYDEPKLSGHGAIIANSIKEQFGVEE